MTNALFAADSRAFPDFPGIFWFCTSRRGGIGQGVYTSFNLASHVGDDPQVVAANRRRLADDLKVAPDRLRLANQVHGVETLVVADPSSWPEPPPDGDALATAQPGLVLMVMTADCVPVLLADPQARVIAAVHAGWRGALHGVIDSSLATMVGLGADRGRIRAIIGPCIRKKAYSVGAEVREAFLAEGHIETGAFFAEYPSNCSTGAEPGKFCFDLAGFVEARLNANGLAQDKIHDLALCTHDREDLFFSHRRSTAAGQSACGRQASGIMLL